MKIIYIFNGRLPTKKAHGFQVAKMCEEFASQNNDLELWLPSRVNNIPNDIFSFYNLKNNFTIKEIKIIDFMKWEKYIGRLAFYFTSFSFFCSLIFKKIEKRTIVYTRNVEIGWLFRIRNRKVVCELHTWPESKTWLYKFFLKKIKRIITITQGIKDVLVKYNFDPKNIFVAPDGVDLEKFDVNISKYQAREKLDLPLDKKIVLYAGHLYKWKGIFTLIEAAKDIAHRENGETKSKDENKKILFVLVGGNDDDIKKIKNLLKENKIDNIFLPGYKPHSEIPIWLKAADVLVLPNTAEQEISKSYTSPLKLFEYMASKRPIIASDLGSIREILGNSNSFLVRSDDPEILQKAIYDVSDDEKKQKEITEEAYRIVKKYTWTKRVERISDFINI